MADVAPDRPDRGVVVGDALRIVPGKLEGDVGRPPLVGNAPARRLSEDVVIDLAVDAAERVEALRADHPVEEQRNRRAEDSRLPRAILAEQEEPTVRNDHLFVVEVPVMDEQEAAQDVAGWSR